MAGEGAEAGAVDQGLGVLDPDADGERFRLDMDAAAVQHGKGVAGAVADGEDDMRRRRFARRRQGEASDMAVGVELDILDPRRKTVFAA